MIKQPESACESILHTMFDDTSVSANDVLDYSFRASKTNSRKACDSDEIVSEGGLSVVRRSSGTERVMGKKTRAAGPSAWWLGDFG